MDDHPSAAAVAALYESDWGRIVAALVGMVGDFDLAEDSAQEAFAAAVQKWPGSGVPEFPRAWIIQTALHKALDRIRRRDRWEVKVRDYEALHYAEPFVTPVFEGDDIPDDRLRLMFTCCHPALPFEAQVALTLRTLAGLETDDIARAFLVPPATMAQRLVRAKRKIQEAGIPYVIPARADIPERLEAVMTVIYLVFNEGYSATRGAPLMKKDLCAEAIRLARLVRELTAPEPPSEVTGLLALMLLHDARRDARVSEAGELVLLDEQNRGRWDRRQIDEALPLVEEALRGNAGPFALQAAIAALHCQPLRAEDTDWRQIAALYAVLERVQPSPVVSLNRAVAIAMAEGPERGLEAIEALAKTGDLDNYHLLHAARADLLSRLGDVAEAAKSYRRALELAGNEPERRFLQERLRRVEQTA